MNEELPEECCAKCRFYMEDEHGQLSCHRYPPTVTPATIRDMDDGERWIEVTYDYPATNGYDWCGEFQPRKETP